jgi:hypothetical protein
MASKFLAISEETFEVMSGGPSPDYMYREIDRIVEKYDIKLGRPGYQLKLAAIGDGLVEALKFQKEINASDFNS